MFLCHHNIAAGATAGEAGAAVKECNMKMPTPWGPAQSELFFHPERKIVQVSTAEHGGVGVSVDLAMPDYFSRLGLTEGDGWLWYEEDVLWAVPAVAFPLYFKPEWVEGAKQTLRDEFPGAYTAHFGEVLTAANSRALERREWERQTVNIFVVTAAFGDWAFDVPKGQVYVT